MPNPIRPDDDRLQQIRDRLGDVEDPLPETVASDLAYLLELVERARKVQNKVNW